MAARRAAGSGAVEADEAAGRHVELAARRQRASRGPFPAPGSG